MSAQSLRINKQRSLSMEGSDPDRRVSAIVNGERRYLCCCSSYGCHRCRSRNPYDGSEIVGRWCSHSTAVRHERTEVTLTELEKRIASASPADPLCESTTADASPMSLENAESNAPLQGDVTGSADDPEQFPIESYLEELGSLLDIVNYAILGFSATAPLIFATPPWSTSTSPPIPHAVPDSPNVGPLRLSTSSPQNEDILTHEVHLYGLLRLVEQYSLPQSSAVEDIRSAIRRVIEDGLQAITEIKMREWAAQRADQHSARTNLYNYRGKDRLLVDCGK